MSSLKKFWELLSGKKRTIAVIYWSVLVPSMMIIWPNGFPEGYPLITYKVVTIFGLFLSAIGLGHAYVKKLNSSNSSEEEVTEQQEQQPVDQDKT